MIRKIIAKIITEHLRKNPPYFLRMWHPYYAWVEHEQSFEKLYSDGLQKTKTPPSTWRKDRFYNLYTSLDLIAGLDGDIAECGVWRGLSSYLMLHKLRSTSPDFQGNGYHVFDSFEGLSAPTFADKLARNRQGNFIASLEQVKKALEDFPNVAYHKGWIPKVFDTIEDQKYRFVHVDLDLQEPTVAALRYFYERLVPGGIMICDDYASRDWPGTKNAVDAFCKELRVKNWALSTCQLAMFH